MIFAARDILVSLAFFATVYCSLSLLIALTWRHVCRISQKSGYAAGVVGSANFLFGLRMFSFAASALVAVFLTFPSFWLMERASLDEDAATFVLAACSLLILGSGSFRAVRAQLRTARAVASWASPLAVASVKESRKAKASGVLAPELSAANGAPPLILVGVRNPKVMVSDTAAVMLSGHELEIAVRHELGHKRSWDNLKKVLISATPFPGMSGLEHAWREAAELAADDAAIANRQDALNLAAALIKLSRSAQPWSEPVLASGLVGGTSLIGPRVERLLAWRKVGHPKPSWPWAFLLFVLLASIASNYGATLALTHRLTEILVP